MRTLTGELGLTDCMPPIPQQSSRLQPSRNVLQSLLSRGYCFCTVSHVLIVYETVFYTQSLHYGMFDVMPTRDRC